MRANAGLLGIVIVSMAVFIALFAGLVSAILPWWLAIALFMPPLIIWAGGKWPHVALVFTMLAAYGYVPIGVIYTDVVVMGFIIFMMILYRQRILTIFNIFRPFWVSLAAFMLWSLLILVYAFFYRRNNLGDIYPETMSMAYWMLSLPIFLLAKDKKSATYAWYILLGVSCLLCLVAISQSLFSIKMNFSGLGTVAEMTSEDGGVPGLARSGVPGIMAVVFLLLLSLINLLNGAKNKLIWWTLLGIAIFAVFVTFGRAIWAGTFVGTFLAASLVGRKAFIKFLVFGSLVAALMIVVILLVKPEIVIGLMNRIFTVSTEFQGKAGGSYQWRVIENHFAKIQMANHPFLGLGYGGEYKPRLVDIRYFSAQTFYIHNGYYYIALKAGFIGLFFYLAHFFNIMRICWKNRKENGVDAAPQLALVATFGCTLMINVTQPELMTGQSIAAFASLAAAVVSLGYWQRSNIKST